MAPICHSKDAEIKELNMQIANFQNKLVVYEERERKSLEEVKLYKDLNVKLADMQNKLIVYEERERKSLEEATKYNELNNQFIELNKKLAVYEYRESKGFEEGNIDLKTKITNLQNDLDFYKERERKGFEEGNICNELNDKLDKQLRILLNLEEREKKDEINLNKQQTIDCEEREKHCKENNSKAESSFKTSLEEYRVKLSELESSNLALNFSNQKLIEDSKQFNNYSKYNNTCLKSWPGVDTTGSVEIEGMEAFAVRCVNDLSSGPGWMLMQKRIDIKYGYNLFYHNWVEYCNGFGNIDFGFFIGLEKLYHVTNAVPHELYIDMEDYAGNKKFARYDNFRVGNESEQYPLKDLGNYTPDSNAGNALWYNKNMKFSTSDRDNDNSPDIHCAKKYWSGWWHNNCTKANLNGRQNGRRYYKEDGLWWLTHETQLKTVRMLIRPKGKN